MEGIEENGEGLVFLISQPRAGSTLLQRILGSHPSIHTVSEPWIMLYPLFAARSDAGEAEYGGALARNALDVFLGELPNGEEDYTEGVRRMFTYIYGQALRPSGKELFLDKTPRYYLIIPELLRVFPRAHFILMFRNPLAVLSSIVQAWTPHWFALHRYRSDILRAPGLLLGGLDQAGEQATVVRYEAVVSRPEEEASRICARLGVRAAPAIVDYGRFEAPKWHYGDKQEVYRRTRPVAVNAEKWVGELRDPQFWRLAFDYLRLLGDDTVERMGYSCDRLRGVLEEHRPGWIRLQATFPLERLLRKPLRQYNALLRYGLFVIGALSRQGIQEGARYAMRRLLRVQSPLL